MGEWDSSGSGAERLALRASYSSASAATGPPARSLGRVADRFVYEA